MKSFYQIYCQVLLKQSALWSRDTARRFPSCPRSCNQWRATVAAVISLLLPTYAWCQNESGFSQTQTWLFLFGPGSSQPAETDVSTKTFFLSFDHNYSLLNCLEMKLRYKGEGIGWMLTFSLARILAYSRAVFNC